METEVVVRPPLRPLRTPLGLDPAKCMAVYLRRSYRNAKGDARNGRSIFEQDGDLFGLAERENLTIVVRFVEKEGTGASRRSRKPRPQWKKALQSLHEGTQFHTLGVWALDRADRRGAVEVGRLLDAHADGSRRIIGVDGTDTSDKRRRLEHIIRAEIAMEESERLGDRVARSKRYARDEGRWLGGPPPFGTEVVKGRIRPCPDEYPVARRIADWLLEGNSMWGLVVVLNGEGLKTRRGNSWSVGTISNLVRSPGWAGLQSIRGRTASGGWKGNAEVYTKPDGSHVVIGEGVITPGERQRILQLLSQRSTVTGFNRKDTSQPAKRGKAVTQAALGNVLKCPFCGSRPAHSGPVSYKYFRCGRNANKRDCPGFSAPFGVTTDAVILSFLSRLASLEPGDALLDAVAQAWTARIHPEATTAVKEATEELHAAQAALARVRELVAAGTFTNDDAAVVMPKQRAALAAAEVRLKAIPQPLADVSPLLDMAQSVDAFYALQCHEQQQLIDLAIRRVEVSKAAKKGEWFLPHVRITIVWADGTSSRPRWRGRRMRVDDRPSRTDEQRRKAREYYARRRAIHQEQLAAPGE